jgi:hypothetical protein
MKLIKTTAGQTALNQRDRSLSARQRQVLIMVNGEREFEAFPAIFGNEVLADLKHLASLGFIIQTPVKAAAKDFSETGTFDISRPADPDLDRALASFVLPASAEPKKAPVGVSDSTVIPSDRDGVRPRMPVAKRSLAAAKMYAIDMMSMFKHVDAPSYTAALQTSETQEELVENITIAMLFLQAAAEPSFSTKVIDRVTQLLPDIHLPQFGVLGGSAVS